MASEGVNKALFNRVQEKVCPNNIWDLTDAVRSALRYQINQLPRRRVSESETRYPTTPAGMRSFLETFFTRHYFQVQNSLIKYLVSEDALSILRERELRILDIGSGPAVASLAITDMLALVLKQLNDAGSWLGRGRLRLIYVLNDTAGICLGTVQRMLDAYFRTRGEYRHWATAAGTFSVEKAFPANMRQLQHIAYNIGGYDIAVFSYVLTPLKEDVGLSALVGGMSAIESLCNSGGRMLILQDKFKAGLMQRVSGLLGESKHREELTQRTCPGRDENDTHTYSYYSCLYIPMKDNVMCRRPVV
jgi:hypothetical protein